MTINFCDDCEYWDGIRSKDNDDYITIGRCRRHAPSIIFGQAVASRKVITDEGTCVIEGIFPVTKGDDWCGEIKVIKEAEDE